MLKVSVDVQMVGIHCRDGGYGRVELQEGTVELIGLDDHRRRLADEHVRPVVAGDAAEEGRAAHAALREDVRDKG